MIRAATGDDAVAIAAIHVVSWQETYGRIVSRATMSNNTMERRIGFWERVLGEATRDIFVAESDHAVVGFICGGAMPPSIRGRAPIPGHDAYVDALYVDAAWHRRGIGRALLGMLAQRLRERGFHSLALHVVQQNPAVGFYVHLGAEFVHAEPLAAGVDEGTQPAYGWRDLAHLAAP